MENRIKEFRAALGISLKDLSNKTGISYNSLWKYENNVTKIIPVNNIMLIAKALNTTSDALFGYTVDKSKSLVKKIYTDEELIKLYNLTPTEIFELEQLKKMALMPTLLFEEGEITEKDSRDLEAVLQNIFITSIKRRRRKNYSSKK